MTFSTQLRQEAEPLFEAIYQHPFVRGLAAGELEKEQIIHYVKQDAEYLNAFIKIYAAAISRCTDREDITFFHQQMAFVLDSETHPHQNLCRVAGVAYDELQGASLAPSAHHYIHHMLQVAEEGTLGEIIAVLLPCPWTYWEIGKRMLKDVEPDPAHPFYEWITFYGGLTDSVTVELCKRLDQWAEGASEKEKEKMKQHFILSCQLEYKFWDMAFTVEEWPVQMEVYSS
ncbi:thiaminase II [Bacillus altitudinis]|uniref:thiaminase II n=1 Tax=Bacillus altitudinis TaxID=293387 RepID=UPI001072D85F|nr:thiaminase II [Bacillus altitudinis]QEO64156.1 thiaminase II [Bacillus altitudinis]